jgi:DNA-binding response OmpR family regulator
VTTILIAEEEARITSFLEKGLRASGFSTEVVRTGEEALSRARSGDYALLVLDLGLPGMDGLEVLRELRSEGSLLPVVILSGRHSVRDKVTGLESGASDYVTKPFRFDELLARIRVRLSDEPSVEPLLAAGDIVLDLHTRNVIAGERTVPLSSREFELAQVFFRRPGQVLSRADLLKEVWGGDLDPGSNIIDVYVGYLRRKLGRDRITSVRGLGYRLEPSPRPRQEMD